MRYQRIISIKSVNPFNYTIDYVSEKDGIVKNRRLFMRESVEEISSVEKWKNFGDVEIFKDISIDDEMTFKWNRVVAISEDELSKFESIMIDDNLYDICPDFIEDNSIDL